MRYLVEFQWQGEAEDIDDAITRARENIGDPKAPRMPLRAYQLTRQDGTWIRTVRGGDTENTDPSE